MEHQQNRIAYVALIMSFQSGVANKMQRLAQSAKDEKIPIDYFWFTTNYMMENKNLAPLHVGNTNHTNPFKVRKWQAEQVNNLLKTYSKVVIRYPLFDPILWLFLKNKKRMITEHHTKELHELKVLGDKRYFMEKTFGNYWLRSFGGIIGVTQEIVNYEIERVGFKGKTLFVPNSIPKIPLQIDEKKQNSLITQIVMVANFRPWHGLDQIIEGLKKHENLASNFQLHLIGEIPEHQKTQLTEFSNLKLYGSLGYQEIEKIYQQMDLGLAGYNLMSKNMEEATALKVREYFANGLAVVLGYRDPAFPKDFPFVLQTDDFDLPKILDFARQLKDTSKTQILQSAEPYISSKFVLQKLYEFCTKPE